MKCSTVMQAITEIKRCHDDNSKGYGECSAKRILGRGCDCQLLGLIKDDFQVLSRK